MGRARRKKTGARDEPALRLAGSASSSTRPPWLVLACLAIVVATIVLVTHWPALSARALSFDDQQYLTWNDAVLNPSWSSTGRFLREVLKPSTVAGYYQPLTMISLMLDCARGGRPDSLGAFHQTSLALHVVNTILVIVLLYQLFGQPWAAAVAGLLFGVHPLTVEPIPWVAERKTLLAAFFSLWCLILYVSYAHHKRRACYVACVLAYAFALMSKPTSTPLPVLMLLLDFWPLGRLTRRALLEKVPLFVVGGVSVCVTLVSQARACGVTLPSQYPASHIPLVLCHNIIFYLWKIVWPANLSSHYSFPEPLSPAHPMVLAGLIGTCVLIPALLLSLRWTRAPLTSWLFFFAAIFPTMGIIGFTIVIAADKFAYLPSVGMLLCLTWCVGRLWTAGSGTRRPIVAHLAILGVAAGLAVAEATATRRYLVHWGDSEALHRHMLSLDKTDPILHNSLGFALCDKGKYNEAIEHLTETVRQTPGYADAHNNLAYALFRKGRIAETVVHGQEALRLNPDDPTAHYVLGLAFSRQGRTDEAVRHYSDALRRRPGLSTALNNLAWILATRDTAGAGGPGAAVELAERACRQYDYSQADTLDTLAAAYAAAARFPDAVNTARRAIELASSSGQTELAHEIRDRLRLYEAGRPYRAPPAQTGR